MGKLKAKEKVSEFTSTTCVSKKQEFFQVPNCHKQKNELENGRCWEMTKGNRVLIGIELLSPQLYSRHK